MKWKLMVAGLLIASSVRAGLYVEQGKSIGRAKLVDVVGGIYYPDTSGRWFNMTSEGYLKVQEQAPAQGFQLIQPSVLSSNFFHTDGVITGIAGGPYTITDSTIAPINVQGYARLALLVYPMTVSTTNGTGADSIQTALLALSWRLHTSGAADSTNTYSELQWNRHQSVANLSAADSSFWRPDTVGTTNMQAYNLVNTGGGASVAADDRLAAPGEVVVALNAMSPRGIMRFPRGRLIYLKTHDGADVSGNYLSIYWRALATVLRSGAIASDTQEIKFRVRADLVGWR